MLPYEPTLKPNIIETPPSTNNGNLSHPPAVSLDRDRHIRYYLRCLRTFLPTAYSSQDSQRLALAFYVVAALDLLSPPSFGSTARTMQTVSPSPSPLTTTERRAIRTWVLSLQHPGGGFCGSSSHFLSSSCLSSSAAVAEPSHASAPNLAATYFALALLALAADHEQLAPGELVVHGGAPHPRCAFAGVDRAATLKWLRTLQRPDGSFGEVAVGDRDRWKREAPRTELGGGNDMRYCYLAAAVRWCLRGDVGMGDSAWVPDIDVGSLAMHIRGSQTFDGGIAGSSQHESHSGYAFCAVAALTLLERPSGGSEAKSYTIRDWGDILDFDALVRFFALRSMPYEDWMENEDGSGATSNDPKSAANDTAGLIAGYNGRWNKMPDTCYTYWTSGGLSLLGCLDVIDPVPSRRFLLEKTTHPILGGFSKTRGQPPDLYHSYLGLSALAVLQDPGSGEKSLKHFDIGLSVSDETVGKIILARQGLLDQARMTTAADTKKTSEAKSSGQRLSTGGSEGEGVAEEVSVVVQPGEVSDGIREAIAKLGEL